MPEHFLVIDISTTATKTLLITTSAEVIAVASGECVYQQKLGENS